MKHVMYAVALVAVLAFAMPALADLVATDLAGYSGPLVLDFHNYDTGVTYNTVTPGTYTGASTLNGLAQTPSPKPANWFGDDSWGVATLTGIYDGNNNLLWGPSQSDKVTAIFFGETDDQLVVSGAGASLEESIAGTGLKVLFYESSNTAAYNASTGYTANPVVGSRTGVDTFTGYTNGNLIWSLNAVQGFNLSSPYQYFDNFFPNGVTGVASSGGFDADIGTVTVGANNLVGSDNSIFSQNPLWNVNFTGQDGNGSFLIKSFDPVHTSTVPAPAAVVLGMFGLGLIGWMRKRSA